MTTSKEEYSRVWDINVRGLFDVSRRMARLINKGKTPCHLMPGTCFADGAAPRPDSAVTILQCVQTP